MVMMLANSCSKVCRGQSCAITTRSLPPPVAIFAGEPGRGHSTVFPQPRALPDHRSRSTVVRGAGRKTSPAEKDRDTLHGFDHQTERAIVLKIRPPLRSVKQNQQVVLAYARSITT